MLAEHAETSLLMRVDDMAGEDDEAKTAITPETLLEVPRPGIGLVQDLVVGETHAELDVGGKFLAAYDLGGLGGRNVRSIALVDGAARLGDEHAGAVVDGKTGGEHVAFEEGLLEFFHVHTFFIHDVFGWSAGEEAGELVIEINEVLCYSSSLRLVCVQYRWLRNPFHDQPQLPTKVVCVLHTDIHALACFRRMCMHRITSQEYSILVVEVRADTLADLVRSPPVAVFVSQLVGCNNFLGSFDDGVWCDLGSISSTTCIWLDLGELDVKSNEFVFAGNDHERS